MKRTTFHPSAPKKLVRAFRRAGTYHATAQALGVNVRYVWELLKKGIEPPDPEVRVKLFLPRRPRRRNGLDTGAGRPTRPAVPVEVKWWRKLPGAARRGLIASLYEMRDELEEKQS